MLEWNHAFRVVVSIGLISVCGCVVIDTRKFSKSDRPREFWTATDEESLNEAMGANKMFVEEPKWWDFLRPKASKRVGASRWKRWLNDSSPWQDASSP
jgi:hypothetical protein